MTDDSNADENYDMVQQRTARRTSDFRQRSYRSPRHRHPTPIYPPGIPARCLPGEFRSACAHRPAKYKYSSLKFMQIECERLTVLSVTFCRRLAMFSASIGCSRSSERSSTALSRSLSYRIQYSRTKRSGGGNLTSGCLRTTASDCPWQDNTP